MDISKNKPLLIVIIVIVLMVIGIFFLFEWQRGGDLRKEELSLLPLEEPLPESEEEPILGLPNPAAVFCEKEGGVLDMRETERGAVTFCLFDEGECEEWAYFRGECTPEEGNVVLKNCAEFEGADVCIEVYEPVCARIMDEKGEPSWKRFSNACHACIRDEVVFGYKDGDCE